MRVVTAAEIHAILSFPALIKALAEAFRSDVAVPMRHHHAIPTAGSQATLLLMPSWTVGSGRGESFVGVKVVSVFPDNPAYGRPTVLGSYLLISGETGEPLAVMDGEALTLRRTAAASALAASHLARPDARRLLMIGAGALAPYLIEAHAVVRPIAEVLVWNRTARKADDLAGRLRLQGIRARRAADLPAAARAADIISVATTANEPVLSGLWLSPGTHVDLVGAFRPTMREADDEAIRRSRIFVDTRAGALAEAGDLVQPLGAGVISEDAVAGDLRDLTRKTIPGRTSPDEITLFKSVGTALEDLAAAMHVYARLPGPAKASPMQREAWPDGIACRPPHHPDRSGTVT